MIATWTAVAVAIGAVISKLVNLSLETANYADQIGDLAEKWGFTTKEIQEFDYWATQNGTTLESLLTGMRGLVNQAQAGSSAFQELGVSVRNADGSLKDQKTLFMETITALQNVENQTKRNALQFSIFGRSGIELGQIINKTSGELDALSQKAEDLGIILDEQTIQKASDFNDKLAEMKIRGQSAFASLIAGADDGMERMDNFINDFVGMFDALAPTFVEIGAKLGVSLLKGIMVALFRMSENVNKAVFGWAGYGTSWSIWDWMPGVGDISTTTNALNSIETTNVSERTTKVDETLEITLNVESDGTVAGEQNLDTISDLLVDKINKALGDMVNG